jgi:hypothetical protein
VDNIENSNIESGDIKTPLALPEKINSMLASTDNLQGNIFTSEDVDMINIKFHSDYKPYKTIKVKAADTQYNALSFKLTTDKKEALSRDHDTLEKNLNALMEKEQSTGIVEINDGNHASTFITQLDEEGQESLAHFFRVASFSRSLNTMDSHTVNDKVNINEYRFSYKEKLQLEQIESVIHSINLDNILKEEMVLDDLYNMLYEKFPILTGEPIYSKLNYFAPISLENILKSRTFTDNSQAATDCIKSTISSINFPFIKDILAVASLGISQGAEFPIAPVSRLYLPGVNNIMDMLKAQTPSAPILIERSEPLRFIFNNDIDKINSETKDSTSLETAGYYKAEYNIVMYSDVRSMVHESTHAVMNLVFNNDSKPYTSKEDKAYNDYQSSVVKLLANVAIKLGVASEALTDQSSDALVSLIKSKTIIDLLAVIKSPSILDTQGYMLGFKYNDIFDAITLQEVKDITTSKLETLNLTASEAEVISRVGTIIYGYTAESFDRELIAYLANLYYDELDDNKAIDDIFAPILEFWQNHIHPKVVSQIEAHQLQCQTDFYNSNNECNLPEAPFVGKMFDHCVADFI